MNKILVVIGLLVVVALGFWLISNMTGNVITGASSGIVANEYFRIDGSEEINETEDLNGTQNSSG